MKYALAYSAVMAAMKKHLVYRLELKPTLEEGTERWSDKVGHNLFHQY
jgi:hypothetical protein